MGKPAPESQLSRKRPPNRREAVVCRHRDAASQPVLPPGLTSPCGRLDAWGVACLFAEAATVPWSPRLDSRSRGSRFRSRVAAQTTVSGCHRGHQPAATSEWGGDPSGDKGSPGYTRRTPCWTCIGVVGIGLTAVNEPSQITAVPYRFECFGIRDLRHMVASDGCSGQRSDPCSAWSWPFPAQIGRSVMMFPLPLQARSHGCSLRWMGGLVCRQCQGSPMALLRVPARPRGVSRS